MINSFKVKSIEVNNSIYHHNTSYADASSVLKYGILTVSELNRLGIKKYSSKTLKAWSDTDSHINGIDSISLSVVGLTDLYPSEDEYDSCNPILVDFNISSDIRAYRTTLHYGNEFLCKNSIEIDKLRAVDVRLLNLIKLISSQKSNNSVRNLIDSYNCLKNIALAIKESNLDIPFREMSSGNLTMDIDKVSNTPKLILK